VNLLPGVQLAFIADPQPHSIPDALKPLVIADYKEKLADVEAVTIVTPTSTHYEIAKTCLAAGKHVLIEKPMTGNIAQAEELVALAKEKGVVLAVGFVERYNPAFQQLLKLIKKERIIGIDIKRFSPFPTRISDADVINDMMIHDLDLLLTLLPKDEIEELRAEGKKIKSDKLDSVDVTMFWRSGIVLKLAANRASDDKTRKIVVTTENFLLEADLLGRKIMVRDLITHLPSVHHTKPADQLTAEISDFIKAIKNKTKPSVPGEAAIKALKLAEEVRNKCS
ncbi:MAG: Gfo/Idh/MocA family oxidoreductase, partial [bacterium]